jgi:hypothetical protein
MKIYKVQPDQENYKSFNLDVEEIFTELGEAFEFNFPSLGISVKEQWKTLSSGEFIQPPEFPNAIAIPDISEWQSGDLVLSEKAYELLEKYLSGYGEFLPVKCVNSTYYIFNVLNILDVVDKENSEQDIDQGVFMGLKRLSFKSNLLEDTLLFKIKYDNLGSIYCTSNFKHLIEELELTGLVFHIDLVSF